ncbi:MAG: hypothetical protein ACLGIB_01235 [Actinomycetota bacterium]
MRRLVAGLVALVLTAPAVGAAPSSAPLLASGSAAEAVRVFAGGGTQLSSGIFFPGTAVANNDGSFTGEPYVVPAGSDILLTNVDHFVVSGGAHGMKSFKRVKRGGRLVPLFASKMIPGPGETLMITSHVKPGTYAYYCPIHPGMLGQLTFE